MKKKGFEEQIIGKLRETEVPRSQDRMGALNLLTRSQGRGSVVRGEPQWKPSYKERTGTTQRT